MKYFLIAGEPSGDLHASKLIRGILDRDPEAQIRFWGGDMMAREAGVEAMGLHYREMSFFGVVEVIKNLGTIKRQMAQCKDDIAAFAPDVVILVDYPGFNMQIAKWAKEQGFTTFYYIAPKVWASREGRIRKMQRYIDRLFIIFPFEVEYFKRWGFDPIFEGNPLVDELEIQQPKLLSGSEFRSENNLDNRPIIALLAGSRRSEIDKNLPLMRNLSEHYPDHQFVVAGVPWLAPELYARHLEGSDIKLLKDQTYQIVSVAEAAVVTSGTATLETALLGTPEVVVYRTSWIQKVCLPLVLLVKYISLVNLNLDKECVREVLQSSMDLSRALEGLNEIIEGGSRRHEMIEDFDRLKAIIGGSGASARFADRMVEELRAMKAAKK